MLTHTVEKPREHAVRCSRLQAWKRNLTGNQPCQHFHLGLPTSRTVRKELSGGRGRGGQDGGGIGRGDHFLSYKFIERTIERWTKFTKQLLIASRGHQVPRKAAHCLRREVGQKYKRLKRDTKERGTETHPGKGVLIEEVSNHQETLALAGLGEVFKSRRAT